MITKVKWLDESKTKLINETPLYTHNGIDYYEDASNYIEFFGDKYENLNFKNFLNHFDVASQDKLTYSEAVRITPIANFSNFHYDSLFDRENIILYKKVYSKKVDFGYKVKCGELDSCCNFMYNELFDLICPFLKENDKENYSFGKEFRDKIDLNKFEVYSALDLEMI